MAGKTRIMGVLNVTPDSFSDGGKFLDRGKAVEHGLALAAEGADVVDVGGESTRPGALPVPVEEELRRVLPVVEALAGKVDVPLSIDSCKPAVARECLAAGASWLNDVRGLRDVEMIQVAADAGCKVVCMHMQGEPRTMQDNPVYVDVVNDIKGYFAVRVAAATAAGVKKQDIVLDPGIGFGKTVEHNLELLARLREFRELGCELLVGASRKSFIGKITGLDVGDRLQGSLAAAAVAAWNGADFVRVHDVAETRRTLDIVDAVKAVRSRERGEGNRDSAADVQGERARGIARAK